MAEIPQGKRIPIFSPTTGQASGAWYLHKFGGQDSDREIEVGMLLELIP